MYAMIPTVLSHIRHAYIIYAHINLQKDWSQQIVPDNWLDASERTPITTLEWMREAELKHSRVCMLAVLGEQMSNYVQMQLYRCNCMQFDIFMCSLLFGQRLVCVTCIDKWTHTCIEICVYMNEFFVIYLI